jgi:hypothetical protein
MTAKRLIDILSDIHATDDPVLTALNVLTELYDLKRNANSGVVRRAIRRLERYVETRVKSLNKAHDVSVT